MSLTDDFIAKIELQILTGKWKIGEKIPTLRQLSDDYNVSRSVVNAGIVELQNKGYLITHPRKYIMVADWKKYGTFAILSDIIKNELYDDEFFENILDCRMTFECAAVMRAVKFHTDDDIKKLRDVLDRERLAISFDERVMADIDFHHLIAQTSHNIVFSFILNFFEDMEKKLICEFYENNQDKQFVRQRHIDIVNAIENGDTNLAVENTKQMLKQGEDIVLKLYFK